MDPEKYDYYSERASKGKITPDEIEEVRAELQNPHHKDKLYKLLIALLHDRTRMHIDVMEPFLNGPDWMSASWALSGLCCEYGSAGDYTKELLSFMRGVDWDWNDTLKKDAVAWTAKRTAGTRRKSEGEVNSWTTK